MRRSSIHTIQRYCTATAHLIAFLTEVRPLKRVSDFQPRHTEEFVRYLRKKKVAPNGHANTAQRMLRDAGVKFILETCSSMMNYAQRHRHLPPYAENVFRTIEVCRMPIEDAKPVVALSNDQQKRFLAACDGWQFPLMLTLLFTGIRSGELVHLLLPEDLDLEEGWLYVRNKPRLGWQVKTRNERDIPLVPVLRQVLARVLAGRRTGPVFRQRRCTDGYEPLLAYQSRTDLEQEGYRCQGLQESVCSGMMNRPQRAAVVKTVWRDLGAVREDWVRIEFVRLMEQIGHSELTAVKALRHTFATILQDANVDPLVRNELLGHAPMSASLGQGLGMTAAYTHTRPATKRRQLQSAVEFLPAYELAVRWLGSRSTAEDRRQVEASPQAQDGT